MFDDPCHCQPWPAVLTPDQIERAILLVVDTYGATVRDRIAARVLAFVPGFELPEPGDTAEQRARNRAHLAALDRAHVEPVATRLLAGGTLRDVGGYLVKPAADEESSNGRP